MVFARLRLAARNLRGDECAWLGRQSRSIVLRDQRPTRRQPPDPGPQREGRLLAIHERTPLRGIFARQQRLDRHVREARIAIARVAIGEGELRGLEPQVERVGAGRVERWQIEALEQAQVLEEHRPLTLPHARAAVGDRERILDRPRIAREILCGHQARVFAPGDVAHRDAREAFDRLGVCAAVERIARGADSHLARATRRALRFA